MMTLLFLAAALVQPAGTIAVQDTAPPAGAQAEWPIRQQAALRCAVAVALAAEQQKAGTGSPADWPDLAADNRGREFFVRTMVQLMDETGATREEIADRARAEAQDLQTGGRLIEVMPACLLMLQASGL